MSWLKKNGVLLLGLILLCGSLGGLGWLEYRDLKRMRAAKTSKKDLQEQLDRLLKTPVAPTTGNVKIAEENVKTFKEGFQQLASAFPTDSGRETVKMGTLDFDSYFHKEFLDKLRKQARESTPPVALPNDFYFGFSSCVRLQHPDDIPALLRQMDVVQQLAQNLIDSKVSEILFLHRYPVEPSLKVAIGAGGPMGGAMGGAPPSPQGDFWAPPTANRPGVYDSVPFEISFVSDVTASQKFLNLLVQTYNDNKRMFLVRSIQTETRAMSASAQTGGLARITPTAVTTTVGKPVGEERPIVPGDEKVQMTLRVDWVQILSKPGAAATPVAPAAPAAAAKPTPPAPKPEEKKPAGRAKSDLDM